MMMLKESMVKLEQSDIDDKLEDNVMFELVMKILAA